MGLLIITYPNAKAVRIYTALVEHFHIDKEIWDEALQASRPKTNAELKIDVDQAIREFLKQRVRMIEQRDLINGVVADQDATFVDTEFT